MLKNYIFNGLDNTIYNVYSSIKSTKALREALDKKKKYKDEDVGMKKFIVIKFLDLKMIDSRTVMSQVQEF
jgi:hypothetical protein